MYKLHKASAIVLYLLSSLISDTFDFVGHHNLAKIESSKSFYVKLASETPQDFYTFASKCSGKLSPACYHHESQIFWLKDITCTMFYVFWEIRHEF